MNIDDIIGSNVNKIAAMLPGGFLFMRQRAMRNKVTDILLGTNGADKALYEAKKIRNCVRIK